MSPGTGKTVPVRRLRNSEVIVGFSPENVRAPFLLRCGALLADYIILICIPVITLVISQFLADSDAKLLGIDINGTGWIIAVLIGATNLIIMPMFTGQSIGKMLTGLRIVRIDGTKVSKGTILVRQVIGYGLAIASLGIGFLLSVLGKKGRALHDYVAGTVVIYADKRLL